MVAQAVVAGSDQLSFDFLPDRPVVVQRHDGQLTSDAGLLPIRQFDGRWDYTGRMAAGLHDPRGGVPRHALLAMLRQRVYGTPGRVRGLQRPRRAARRPGVQARRGTPAR